MRQVTVGRMWMLAFLMAGLVAGCGSTQTTTTNGAGTPVGPVGSPGTELEFAL